MMSRVFQSNGGFAEKVRHLTRWAMLQQEVTVRFRTGIYRLIVLVCGEACWWRSGRCRDVLSLLLSILLHDVRGPRLDLRDCSRLMLCCILL